MLETCVEPSTVKMVLSMKVTMILTNLQIFILNNIDLRNRCLLEQSKQKRDCQVLWLQ